MTFHLRVPSFIICALLLSLPVRGAGEAANLLPDRIGEFQAAGSPRGGAFEDYPLAEFPVLDTVKRIYLDQARAPYSVTLVRLRTEPAAYALLTSVADRLRQREAVVGSDQIGTWGVIAPSEIAFFKGACFVLVSKQKLGTSEGLRSLARGLAEKLDRGEGDIPPLVRHLPDWESAQNRAVFTLSLGELQAAAGHRPALEALSFDGGTEAITASYGPARLVIVEHTTPQFAADNDRRIIEHLKNLRAIGAPLPSLYRRIGNYAVFVFDAPDEGFARRLADAIRYEQVVRWLGPNPRAWERWERAYNRMTASVVVTTLKVTGLALILCLSIGSVLGGVVFFRRRARAAKFKNYTDAGDMVRLNIDELTAQTDPTRLLGPAK